MALKQIKNKIVATKKTGQVTKAMESVSAVKMRKSQERAFLGRPYVHAALRILARLAESSDAATHPLMQNRNDGKILAIIVTSDKGLAGSVNSAVLKQAEKLFREHSAVDVIAVGRKAVEFAAREKKTILASYTNVSDSVTVADVYDMTAKTIGVFSDTTYQSVMVIYQNFISTFEQSPTVRKVLPLDTAEIHYIMQGIKPKVGKFSNDEIADGKSIAYTVEPSPEEVMNTLLPQLVQIFLYHALLESKASEHSARMVAMKNATDKAKEMVKSLTVKFNKQRQAKITAEISEITAGVAAME
jgi:F-type H+-transporting ATPase subunit gamma